MRTLSNLRLLGTIVAIAGATVGLPALAQQKVLRAVPHADLKVLDNHTGSIQITKIYGLMVYDQLFAWDEKLQAKPMMVGDYTVSADGLKYTFKLRPGLKWHDGTKVTSKDVVPSIKRWASRDAMGQKLMEFTAAMEAVDEDSFTVILKQPYGFVEFTLGSDGPQIPTIYREKEAATDAFTAITETIGSGPFKFNRAEWQPGVKLVFDKNKDYVPRNEPPNGMAGGKVVKVDRVEWNIIPDTGTAAAALTRGEVDFWDSPPNDQVPIIEKSKDVVVAPLTPFGNIGFLRTNTLFPPFNDYRARLALAYLFDQRDFQRAASGDERWWKVCYAMYICDTPFGTEAGAEEIRKLDRVKAKQLMADAGYKGEKLVLTTTAEIKPIGDLAQVAVAQLREIGVNVDMQLSDWGTVVGRIAKMDPPDKGGWNMFASRASGTSYFHPVTNTAANMSCDRKNWVGWPCDETATKLRDQVIRATDEGQRKALMETYHRRLIEQQPYTLLGQFQLLFAWRKEVTGVLKSAVLAYWNMEKS
ncbi:MAG: ABC transporter substrate-binding protein [Proteobacteria bacterium]|nr:ABC transporter substrate-binding protein [Pseudomonadota bacterium]MBI3499500.1 ABC transporter substrate-binding protein [Pseudomonadota bacterium]